jgi:hypothetical protein
VAVFDDFQPANDEDFSPAAPIIIKRPSASPAKVFGMIGPAWTRGEIEAPAGSKDMGGWQAAVYSEEQQKRLRVDEHGARSADDAAGVCFVVMGTVGLFLALECVRSSKTFENAPIAVVSALNVPLTPSDASSWTVLLATHRTIICIEDDSGALYREVCVKCLQLSISTPPKVLSKCTQTPGPSCRTFGGCLRHHRFTVADVQSLYSSSS